MFLDTLIIMGIKTISVAIMLIKVFISEAPMNSFAITKAATEKAIPTP